MLRARQVCVFLSCFGIGISLLSLLPQEGGASDDAADGGTVSDITAPTSADGGDGNGDKDINGTSTGSGVVIDGVCPNDLLLVFGIVIVVLPIVFFLTIVWRLWRSPSPLRHFAETSHSDNLMARSGSLRIGASGGDRAMVSASRGSDAAALRDVELAVS